MINERKISLAKLNDYPEFLGIRYLEAFVRFLNDEISAFIGQHIEKNKAFNVIFFTCIEKENEKYFSYLLTQKEIELLKRNNPSFIEDYKELINYKWEPRKALVAALLGEKHLIGCSEVNIQEIEGLRVVLEADWENKTRQHIIWKLSEQEKQKRQRIIELETKFLVATQNYLLDVPINDPFEDKLIGALQITSNARLDNGLEEIVKKIKAVASAFWLAKEIDEIQADLISDLPTLIFLGKHFNDLKRNVDDCRKIVRFSYGNENNT